MSEFARCPTLNEKVRKWNYEISKLTNDFDKLTINDINSKPKESNKINRVNQIIGEIPHIQLPKINKTRRKKTPEKEKTPERKKTPEKEKIDKVKMELVYLLNKIKNTENKTENTNLSKQIQEKFDNLLHYENIHPIYICPSDYSKIRLNSEPYHEEHINKRKKMGGKSKSNRKKKNKTKNRK